MPQQPTDVSLVQELSHRCGQRRAVQESKELNECCEVSNETVDSYWSLASS